MVALKILPPRPSLQSIRKEAKSLARDVNAGNSVSLARVRAQLSDSETPLTLREAQLVLAREYGFAGWHLLKEEVVRREDKGLEWTFTEAERAIQHNDIERLRQLLTTHPDLVDARTGGNERLLKATTSFAMDCDTPEKERIYTRPECTRLLIDAGAVVTPTVWTKVIRSGSAEMLRLLWNEGTLPAFLPIAAAVGDMNAVNACFDESGALRRGARPEDLDDLGTLDMGFLNACRFKHTAVASLLLDRCAALDEELRTQVEAWRGRAAFVDYMCEHNLWFTPTSPWRAFVMRQLTDEIDAGNLPAYTQWLRSQTWLLGAACIDCQVELLERATWTNHGPFIEPLLDLDPAILHLDAPPESQAIEFAFEFGNTQVLPLLTRIWPVPDDLPHAAGVGDLARVARWFDGLGQPALGDLKKHYPVNNPGKLERMHWGKGNKHQVLDVALAWACMNNHFEVAAFLLEHGANINTNWSTHEPASILHEVALRNNWEATKFLVDHGIDLELRDSRFQATAAGWAYNASQNKQMAEFLMQAQERRAGS